MTYRSLSRFFLPIFALMLIAIPVFAQDPFASEEPEPWQMGVACFVWLIILAAIIQSCLIMQKAMSTLPEEQRVVPPGLIWLSLIPCLGNVWVIVYAFLLTNGYKQTFRQQGSTDQGDCGLGLAIAWAVLTAFMFVPCVNYIAAIPFLVVWALYLRKASTMQKALQLGGGDMSNYTAG